MRELPTMERNKVYFAGDFHLGTPTFEKSLAREKMVVRWLGSIEEDAAELFLLGDVFDFWFEYKYVVPKHFVRFLGALARLSDAGCRVHFFCGNHDLWQRDYFEKELGLVLHRDVETVFMDGKTFFWDTETDWTLRTGSTVFYGAFSAIGSASRSLRQFIRVFRLQLEANGAEKAASPIPTTIK